MMKKKVVSIQFAVKLADLEYNQNKVRELIKQAWDNHKPDIVLLPETWNLGFFPENVRELAEDYQNSSSVKLINELVKKYQINIIAGSIIIKENELIRNRSISFNRNGDLIHSHDKGHLFSPSQENAEFTKGIENQSFFIDGIKAAHIICYDLRFPEYARRLALDGAKILFVSAEWPHPRQNHWQILNKARAVENQMYLVSANGSGTANGLDFCGHSAVINPWGETITESGEEKEVLLFAEIDIEEVDEIRKKIPVFNDRNLNLY